MYSHYVVHSIGLYVQFVWEKVIPMVLSTKTVVAGLEISNACTPLVLLGPCVLGCLLVQSQVKAVFSMLLSV